MITCEFEFGKRTNQLRHTTVDAIMIRDGKILLTKRAKQLLDGDTWAIPGGFMDRDETATQAEEREVLEETGYRVKAKTLLGIRDNPNRRHDDRQNITRVFAVELVEQVTTMVDPAEVTAIEWWPLHQLPPVEAMAFDHREIIELYAN